MITNVLNRWLARWRSPQLVYRSTALPPPRRPAATPPPLPRSRARTAPWRPSRLHQRLVERELGPIGRPTGAAVAKLALELAATTTMAEALKEALVRLDHGDSMSAAQLDAAAATALRLIGEGLRPADAVKVVLQEPLPKHSAPMPSSVRARLFPSRLTGQNVVSFALELNASGVKMDDALVQGLTRFAAPRPLSTEQASLILEAAQKLFAGGARVADALQIALRQALGQGSLRAA